MIVFIGSKPIYVACSSGRLFASFLSDIRKKYDEAEYYYQRALELDPEDAFATASYGNFMLIVRKDIEEAERLYKKALQLDPYNAVVNAKMANFMANQGNDPEKAEYYYLRTLELDPERPNVNANYAGLLLSMGRLISRGSPLVREHWISSISPIPTLEMTCYVRQRICTLFELR